MSKNLEKLIKELKGYSIEGDVIPQWELVGIYKCDGAKCVCGKSIKNVFVIWNNDTEKEVDIGSECIKYFTGEKDSSIDENEVEDFAWMFSNIVKAYETSNIKRNTVLSLYRLDKITLRNKDFMLSLLDTKNVSEKQRYWKDKLSREFLEACKVISEEGVAKP